MDQVKVILSALKKHHFWVLALVVVISGLSIYMATASDLQTRYQTRKKKLDGALQQRPSDQPTDRSPQRAEDRELEKKRAIRKA